MMWTVTIYGLRKPLVVVCETYVEALEERNVWQGLGVVIEIEEAGVATTPPFAATTPL